MSYVEDSYRYDQYYRLLELEGDPVIGAEIKALKAAYDRFDHIQHIVMDVDKEKGFEAVRKYLKENPK